MCSPTKKNFQQSRPSETIIDNTSDRLSKIESTDQQVRKACPALTENMSKKHLAEDCDTPYSRQSDEKTFPVHC